MNARMIDGRASATGERRSRPPRDASRQPDRSQVKTPAQAAGSCTGLTTCKTQTAAFQQRPPSGMKERLGPPSGPATIPRITDPGTAPDLFTPSKGLSMAKTAPVFLQLAMKSVPVADLLQSAHLLQARPRETMLQRSYTLCEVLDGTRKWFSTQLMNIHEQPGELGCKILQQ